MNKFVKLREEIKALAAEGRGLNPAIQAASGRLRSSLRREKAEVGDRARHLLIAYAFLRGAPYAAMENPATCVRVPVLGLVKRHAEAHSPGSTGESALSDWYLSSLSEPALSAAAE